MRREAVDPPVLIGTASDGGVIINITWVCVKVLVPWKTYSKLRVDWFKICSLSLGVLFPSQMHSSNTLHQGCDGELCDIWEGDYPMLSSQNNCQLWIFQQRIFVGSSEFWWLSKKNNSWALPESQSFFSISKGLLPPCHMRSSESSIFRLRKSWPAPAAPQRRLNKSTAQNPRIP